MPRHDTKTEMSRRASGGWDRLLLGAVVVVGIGFGSLLLSASITGAVTGHVPHLTQTTVMAAIASPGRAGAIFGAGPTWMVWSLTLLITAFGLGLGVSVLRAQHRARLREERDVRRQKGLPDAGRVRREYGARQVLARRSRIRPDLARGRGRARVTDYAFEDGRSAGVTVYTSFETPTMLLAPSRVGKTQSIIAPRAAAAPGAVLSTSTKVEVVQLTRRIREAHGGPMMVCDPEGVGAEAGLSGTVRWSLWSGCEDISEALARARVLAAGSGSGVQNADFWEATTRRVFTPLLHAAALDPSVDMPRFQKWCFDAKDAKDALEILRETPGAGDLATMLASVVEMDDPETRANMWAPAANIGVALVDRRVRETFGPGGEQFDIDAFLRESGTLYLLGQDDGNAGSLMLTLVDAVWRRAVVLANGAPGGRMEPPMHMSLDEIGNIGTLPALPRMMSEGGGLGIQTTAAFQSLAQAELRYGPARARAMWEAATQRIVLGGVVDDQVLAGLQRTAGKRTVVSESMSSARGRDGIGRSYSSHDEDVLGRDQIETMPRGVGVMIEATKPLIVTEFEPFFRRYKGKRMDAAIADIERRRGVGSSGPSSGPAALVPVGEGERVGSVA